MLTIHDHIPFTSPDTFSVYLLHWDTPLGRTRHYVGSCLTYRLQQRLIEHALGRGSTYTKNINERNAFCYLAQVWQGPDRSLEEAVKKRGFYSRHCPVCDNPIDGKPIATIDLRPFHENREKAETLWATLQGRNGPAGTLVP